MGTWEIAILTCLKNIGKEAMLSEIYRCIENSEIITQKHLEPKWDDRPGFQHDVRSYISKLEKSGFLERVGSVGSGVYSITEKGKKRIDFNFDDLDI